MALRHVFIAAGALASLAACNLNSNNNAANNAAAENSAPAAAANAAPESNSAANATMSDISNAAEHPMVGGGDNQH